MALAALESFSTGRGPSSGIGTLDANRSGRGGGDLRAGARESDKASALVRLRKGLVMGVQIFLIHPKNNEDDYARESIAEYIAQHGGFILMATSYGSLIAAFDEAYLEGVKAHYLV